MRFYLISLGCPKNLTDSEDFCARLAACGHELTFDLNEAEAVIINTCAFLASSLKEARENIKFALKLKERGKIKKVLVTGCAAERLGKEIKNTFPSVDNVFSLAKQAEIENIFAKKGQFFAPIPKTLHSPEYKISLTLPHSAYLKIADGCNNRCAYCAIPFIRGIYRSKPIEEVVREASIMAQNGVKEFSLIAQDTTSYGTDLYGKPQLEELLKKLVKIKKLERIRIMYAYPHRVTKELAKIMAAEEKIFNYLDIPLQHINSDILKNMRRHCGPAQIKEVLQMLRAEMPDIAIRTNFIVGFPQESDRAFEELNAFVKEYKFDNVGVFEYSREKDTAAYDMKGQIPPAIKRARADELQKTQSRVIDGINKKLAGSVVEAVSDSQNIGRTYKDAPDIDGTLRFQKPVEAGKILKVKIISAKGYERVGKQVK